MMTASMETMEEAQPARGRRRWPALVITLVGVIGLAWVLTAPPSMAAGVRAITNFAPDRLAALEQEAWEAYYYRQWPRLFWLLLQVNRTQFGLSWGQAIYGSYLATQAQIIFARQGAEGGGAQEYMRQFYALVKEPSGARYDPDHAAAAELRWWVVHRQRHSYPDYSELVRSMTVLYAEVYGADPAAVEEAARHRVAAVEVSDRWLDAQQPAGSPLLQQVRQELLTGYTALKRAVAQS